MTPHSTDVPIRLAIAGISGRMGTTIAELAGRDPRFAIAAALTQPGDPNIGEKLCFAETDIVIAAKLPPPPQGAAPYRPCDVLIDFTTPDGTMHWLQVCERLQIPMVIGTTGHSEAQVGRIKQSAHLIPIVKAANFSLGVAALIAAAARLTTELGEGYDIEIVETHHRHKTDAPSGTAMAFYEAILAARGQMPTIPVFGRQGRPGERKPEEIGIHALRMGEYAGRHEIHFSSAGETISLTHTAHSREAFAAGALSAASWICAQPAGWFGIADMVFSKKSEPS